MIRFMRDPNATMGGLGCCGLGDCTCGQQAPAPVVYAPTDDNEWLNNSSVTGPSLENTDPALYDACYGDPTCIAQGDV